MGGKFSPVIIIVLLLVIIALGLLGFQLLTGTDTGTPGTENDVVEDVKIPMVDLKKEIDESGKIKIIISAVTEDEQGIDYIILPNDESVKSDKAEYEVTENGIYEVKATGVNGQTGSSKIEITEIAVPSATNPYIPSGFEHIGGEVETGYVIADKEGNQYVWVPVPTGKMKRSTELDTKYEEKNDSAAAFVNSVAKYYGFYVGRFEASEYEMNGKRVAATMSGKIPWTNINCQEATEYAKNAALDFGYTDETYTSLINSYAWDTVVAWIEEQYPSYSSSTGYGNYEGTILPTGATDKDKLRGICDFSGNIREWTTEKYLSADDSKSKKDDNNIYRVIRGGAANLSRTPSSHIGYQENTIDPYWGFRIVLYKQ